MASRTILVGLADDSGLERRLQVGRSLADRSEAARTTDLLIARHAKVGAAEVPDAHGDRWRNRS
jgi:hypothetical protein